MIEDPNSPAVLAVVPTEAEAALLVNHLADQGIKAYVAGAGSALGLAVLVQRVDVQVVVRQADLARALESLDLIRDGGREHEADDFEEE